MAITRHLFLLFTLLLFTAFSINTYAGPVTVPDVVDTPQANAEDTINAVDGLSVGAVTSASSTTIVIGNVISQVPAAESVVDAGTEVDLVISSGVVVPNVTGLNLTDATSALGAVSLTVGATFDQSSDTVPAGDVISQDPVSGTNVDGGSAVDLVISTGPVTTTTTTTTTAPATTTTTAPATTTTTAPVTTTTTAPVTTTTTAPVTTTTTAVATTTTTAVATTTTTIEVTTTTTVPPGGDTVVIDGCDTGVEDTGGIQVAIDACAAGASNHGQFVRCVALFTRDVGMSQTDRRPVMKCAAQSSIGMPGATAASTASNGATVTNKPAVQTVQTPVASAPARTSSTGGSIFTRSRSGGVATTSTKSETPATNGVSGVTSRPSSFGAVTTGGGSIFTRSRQR